jgi:phage repressor protein C with HTH and peptisase S24 domain
MRLFNRSVRTFCPASQEGGRNLSSTDWDKVVVADKQGRKREFAALLQELGLTQARAADLLGVHIKTVQRYADPDHSSSPREVVLNVLRSYRARTKGPRFPASDSTPVTYDPPRSSVIFERPWPSSIQATPVLTSPPYSSEPSSIIRKRQVHRASREVTEAEPIVDREKGVVLIARVSVAACAGTGLQNYSEVVLERVALPYQWLHRLVGAFHGLRIIDVVGDSMVPTFAPNTSVLCRVLTGYVGGGVYTVEQDGDLLLKRVQKFGGGVLRVFSDNAIYQEELLEPLPESDCLYRSQVSGMTCGFSLVGKVVLNMQPI